MSLPLLPASQWRLPVPKIGWAKEADYAKTERKLEAHGFVCVQRNESLPASHYTTLTEYALWAHPAGALVRLSSRQGPQKRHVGDMELMLQRDVGLWSDPFEADLSGGGSSSQQRLADGSTISISAKSVDTYVADALPQMLRYAQSLAPLLPFDQWVPSHLYLDPELWVARTPYGPAVTSQAAQAARAESVAQWPDEPWRQALATVLTSPSTPAPSTPVDLHTIAPVLRYYRDTSLAAGQRFPEPDERLQLARWAALCAPEAPLTIDPADYGPVQLSSGVSLAGALAWGVYTPGDRWDTSDPDHPYRAFAPQHNGSRLAHLLAHAPQDAVAQWVQVPDAHGVTLPMLLAHAAQSLHTVGFEAEPPSADLFLMLFQGLAARVPVHEWVWVTPERSVPGLWWEEHVNAADRPAAPEQEVQKTFARARFLEVVKGLAAMGVDTTWPVHATLPVYPERYGDAALRAIVAPEGASVGQVHDAWRAQGELARHHQEWVERCFAQELTEQLVVEAPKASRPRL